MGAWGFQAFENDDALDWLEELEAGGAEVVRHGLNAVTDGYIEAPEECCCRGCRDHRCSAGEPARRPARGRGNLGYRARGRADS
ncbi:DUF4259 domain-containing protein [Arthrobacter sp. NPDC093125]|uniref:DUF4259 domain-containing protein n=1 Tax=Arthrobacter sp. NPDC093125 TaxID=3363944 RepID=UPI00380EBDFF